MTQFVVSDLDGTIRDDAHRVEVWAAGKFDECHAIQHLDAPNSDVCWLLKTLVATDSIGVLIVTACDETYRPQAEAWLTKNRIYPKYTLMRPAGNVIESEALKIQMLEEFFGSKQEVLDSVLFVLEDRDKVVKALREYGLKTWHVREGKY